MNLRKKTTACLSVGMSLSTLYGVGCIAAEELPETVISSNRTEELLKNSPYSVSVIGEDDLLDGAIRTLPEALKLSPGVMIQKTAYGHGSPFIRGFTGRQNLLLVDGVRINNSTFRSGPVQYWNTVDSFAVDRLELVKGQGSVLFGSDAIGGTLNTLTRSSNFQDYGAGWFNRNTAFYRYDTNSRSHVSRLETAFGQGGKWGVLLGVSNKDFGDIKDSAVGRMKNTGYDELDVDFRLDWAINDSTTMTLAHQSIDQDDVWRWHSTIYNPGWTHGGHVANGGSHLSRIYDQERSLTYLKFAGGEGEGWLKKWDATLSYQKSQDSEYNDRGPGNVRHKGLDVETWGLAVQMESDLGPGELLYGLDYYHDEVDSWALRNGADRPSDRPVADDSTYDLLGIFAQYRWSPVRSLPKLKTSLGVRYTYADAHLGKYYQNGSDVSADKSWDNWVFSGRALYELNDCWNIFAGVSQGFRAPNLDDLSGSQTALSGINSKGSLGAEPEEFLTYEIGGRYVHDDLQFAASVYYTDIESVIVRVPETSGGSDYVNTNAQEGKVYGVEAELAYNLNDCWKFSLQGSWQDGETLTNTYVGGPLVEDYISRVAPLMGSVSLRWTHPGQKFWIEGRVIAAETADKLSAGNKTDTQRIPTGGTPSYIVASLYAGWQATDDLSLTLGLENLTDEDYRIHGSGQNEPGFNAILGVRVNF